jgi:orotate phosphoribosyltransferase
MMLQEFLTHLAAEPDWSHAGPVTPRTRALNGDTPLHAAIWAGDDEAARALIDAGADVNAAGEDGYTPLHAAIAQVNVRLARRLTDRGASWDAVNAFNCSVREAARRSGEAAIRTLFEEEAAVSTLPGRIGHFPLESGHHSDLWLDLQLLCARPEFIRPRAVELARRLVRFDLDLVCGPLVEGAFVALMVASELGVAFCYAEPYTRPADAVVGDEGLFPVAYRIPGIVRGTLAGKRVAIVNDVIGAGSAVRGAFEDLSACGATVLAVAALAVVGTSASQFANRRGVTLETLASFPTTIWTPADCPLCQSAVPLEKTP